MQKLFALIFLMSSMSVMGVEFESGTYENSLVDDSCDYQIINANIEGVLYLTLKDCEPQALNLKLLSTDGGITFIGQQDSGWRYEREIILKPISGQAFKIKYNLKYETGESRAGSDYIYRKKISCQ